MKDTSKWVQTFKSPSPQSEIIARIICFPFAGGGTQSYADWVEYLPNNIEVCAVRLPGRELRINEKPYKSLAELLDEIIDKQILKPYLDKPFFLFGHSLGALIAYELAVCLQQKNISPISLIISGRVAPHRKSPREPVYQLPIGEFVEALRSLGGTPPEVLGDEELMSIVIPVLRADFEINEGYEYRENPKLTCDLVAFAGTSDNETQREAVLDWADLTSEEFKPRMVPGDHFFIQNVKRQFLRMLSIELLNSYQRIKKINVQSESNN
ncbi:thioesterase II family protein [Idiomarina xiamenensis]|uniref:Putative type II thioesterase n=1 Tax=Idiomarina xiamenensis 10-D-4 TaxID=740709 RepID=K2JXH5_9GAMM|nr:alpha/beta fold hydrolase [Idiomarina xiamenensis]EKE79322.1 putative type II thioesterase [Idiomarina xiamenensis 10-D-4]